VAWAAGLTGAAIALAPWLSGSVYVGARPVAPDATLGALLWGADMPLTGMLVVSALLLTGFFVAALARRDVAAACRAVRAAVRAANPLDGSVGSSSCNRAGWGCCA
jgi:hypothetical protein